MMLILHVSNLYNIVLAGNLINLPDVHRCVFPGSGFLKVSAGKAGGGSPEMMRFNV